MGQSYRIRTELGVNKTIQVQLDQEFEFLEILSLKLQQEDIYLRACSDYGVIVGRVTANNGLGIPNARVSVFIPIEVIDQSNPLVTSLYPYKSPTDKNEDGYRYNLLPYVQSHTGHSPTGTLPSRLDVLTGKTVSEIYDKYYKFTAKTNDSGDYMIMGVPVGEQNLVMDVDLSDIGEFSLTPQDLIRIGRATEAQVAGNRFKTSTDLNSLPQIINLTKTIEVSPLWGEPSICQIAINRLDFDLRDDANIDIQPTSVFMGSIYSTNDQFRVRGAGGKIRDDFGNLCQLQAGPGQILAIRQTIFQDTDGNPILEQYRLEQNGNVIDGNGSWLVELPMNLDYFITNEFGEKVLSNDPTIGVPTKGKYRFKIKWQQSSDLTEQTRRPYYLVPNVREFGWTNTVTDPNIGNVSQAQKDQLQSSYYFGLDWSGYTKGITSVTQRNNKLNQIINCEDTFYQFDFNRVYTVSGLIDQYKNGGRGRFVGIKEIDNNECAETVNKFPVNEGFRNFDLIYFLFAFLMQIFQIIGLPLIVLYHFVSWLWNNFAVVIVALMIGFVTRALVQTGVEAYSFVAAAVGNPFTWNMVLIAVAILFRLAFYTFLLVGLIKLSKKLTGKDFKPIKLPMVQYPDCQACQCDNGGVTEKAAEDAIPPPGFITQTSSPLNYQESMTAYWSSRLGMTADNENYEGALASVTQSYPQSIGGNPTNIKNPTIFKTSKSSVFTLVDSQGGQSQIFTLTYDLPIGERINIYNLRQKYFNNYNKIKVTFNSPSNYSQNTQKFHYDNTLTVLSTEAFEPGTILTFVNPSRSNDPNFKFTGSTANGQTYNGIWGKIPNNARQINVKYATSQTSDTTVTYNIPAGDTPTCTDSVSINVTEPGILTYQTCLGYTSAYTASVGSHTITNLNGILTDSLTGDLEFTIVGTGQNQVNYSYPSDIEYYQVVTAITVTTTTVNNQKYYSLPGLAPVNSNNQTANPSFWNLITTNSRIIRWVKCDAARRDWWNTSPTQRQGYVDYNDFNGTSIDNFSEQKVLILQRGVDPYSPTYINRYGIGKILGHSSEDAVVITAETKLNIPIQKLPNGSTTTVQKHDNQVNIFSSSYFFTPGVVGNNNPGFQYIPYSSSAVGYYGALDSSTSTVNSLGLTYYSSSFVTTQSNGSVLSRTTNYFYPQNRGGIWPPNFFRGSLDTKYDNSEDLSGGAILSGRLGSTYEDYIRRGLSRCAGIQYVQSSEWNGYDFRQIYFSPNLYPTLTGSPISISNGTLNVMRTDRLPSSDYADNGENWEGSVSLLQQNLGFQIYNIFGGDSANGLSFSTGAEIPTADLEGQYAVNNVFTSLNTCEKMVGLTCYSGNGVSFGIKSGCEGSDAVDNGCYVMVQKPLTDLFNGKDFRTFAEWGFRFRFFYGLCRGILAQSFTNNWVNGSLFMFPIQVDRYFDRNNKPLPPVYPKKIIYFDNDTNNFYFRSSPFVSSNSRFIGAPATTSRPQNSVNSRNLLFPTTVINLGMKDSFYDEIMFDPATAAYVMDRLNPTSYSDTSDLVNLFVISRITDETFLKQLIPLKDNSLNQLFSRNGTTLFVQPKSRVDADLAQMMSINSEVGVIPFSPEFYPVTGGPNDPVVVVGALNQMPTMGVYFSSTTFNLQDKDFISPGVINFRPNPNNTAITYEYGIKSQVVPFYRWEIKQQTGTGAIPNIFGSERNNWATNYNSNSALSDIQSYPYQSLSRRSQINPHYFIPSNTTLDIYQRGYIFDVNANGNFNLIPPNNSPNDKILVGAPYHFYFGLIKGETALDKFKTKYGINE